MDEIIDGVDTRYFQKYCYFCGEKIDNRTRDHVPPKGFFPKGYREGELITVPSCEEHNQGKSQIDEIIRGIVAIITTAEHVDASEAAEPIVEKTKRSWKKSIDASDVVPAVLSENPPLGRINREGFLRGMSKISRGLYYHIFREPWGEGRIIPHTPHLFDSESAKTSTGGQRLLHRFHEIQPPTYGDNPEVFTFQAIQAAGMVVLRMNFYECVPIVAIQKDEQIEQAERADQFNVSQEKLDVHPDSKEAETRDFGKALGLEMEMNWKPVKVEEEHEKSMRTEKLVEHELEDEGLEE